MKTISAIDKLEFPCIICGETFLYLAHGPRDDPSLSAVCPMCLASTVTSEYRSMAVRWASMALCLSGSLSLLNRAKLKAFIKLNVKWSLSCLEAALESSRKGSAT